MQRLQLNLTSKLSPSPHTVINSCRSAGCGVPDQADLTSVMASRQHRTVLQCTADCRSRGQTKGSDCCPGYQGKEPRFCSPVLLAAEAQPACLGLLQPLFEVFRCLQAEHSGAGPRT